MHLVGFTVEKKNILFTLEFGFVRIKHVLP